MLKNSTGCKEESSDQFRSAAAKQRKQTRQLGELHPKEFLHYHPGHKPTPKFRPPAVSHQMQNRQSAIPTPGARVIIRDAEWIVRRVDHAPGGYQIVCDGISELVRGREAVYLTALEPNIQVIDPVDTRLVPDTSAQFADSILYMESQLRQAVPNDGRIHVGHTAAMDPVPYQLDPARLALARPRQRILIADAVGLGKTLEAGILVSELIARGRGRRISGAGSKEHADAISEGVLEPLHDPPHEIGLHRHSTRAPPYSHESQPFLLLRQGHHLH